MLNFLKVFDFSTRIHHIPLPLKNKTKAYPICHPTIIFHDFESLENDLGIIRAKRLPPIKLWLQVLLYCVNGETSVPFVLNVIRTSDKADGKDV